MAITRWDPMNELRSTSRRLKRVSGAPRALEPQRRFNMLLGESWPQVDINDDKEQMVVRADVPGMAQKVVEVVLEDGSLILRGERKMAHEDKREGYVHVESS